MLIRDVGLQFVRLDTGATVSFAHWQNISGVRHTLPSANDSLSTEELLLDIRPFGSFVFDVNDGMNLSFEFACVRPIATYQCFLVRLLTQHSSSTCFPSHLSTCCRYSVERHVEERRRWIRWQRMPPREKWRRALFRLSIVRQWHTIGVAGVLRREDKKGRKIEAVLGGPGGVKDKGDDLATSLGLAPNPIGLGLGACVRKLGGVASRVVCKGGVSAHLEVGMLLVAINGKPCGSFANTTKLLERQTRHAPARLRFRTAESCCHTAAEIAAGAASAEKSLARRERENKQKRKPRPREEKAAAAAAPAAPAKAAASGVSGARTEGGVTKWAGARMLTKGVAGAMVMAGSGLAQDGDGDDDDDSGCGFGAVYELEVGVGGGGSPKALGMGFGPSALGAQFGAVVATIASGSPV